MKRSVHGFTLVEVMIVVAVIGLLAAVAMPAYQNYSIRTKVTEAILALSPCRTSVGEAYQSGGTGPGGGNWGCEQAGSRYVEAVTTDTNGVATATLRNISADVNGKHITLTPLIGGVPADATTDMGKGVTGWVCGGSGTDLGVNYLPSTCRGT